MKFLSMYVLRDTLYSDTQISAIGAFFCAAKPQVERRVIF